MLVGVRPATLPRGAAAAATVRVDGPLAGAPADAVAVPGIADPPAVGVAVPDATPSAWALLASAVVAVVWPWAPAPTENPSRGVLTEHAVARMPRSANPALQTVLVVRTPNPPLRPRAQ